MKVLIPPMMSFIRALCGGGKEEADRLEKVGLPVVAMESLIGETQYFHLLEGETLLDFEGESLGDDQQKILIDFLEWFEGAKKYLSNLSSRENAWEEAKKILGGILVSQDYSYIYCMGAKGFLSAREIAGRNVIFLFSAHYEGGGKFNIKLGNELYIKRSASISFEAPPVSCDYFPRKSTGEIIFKIHEGEGFNLHEVMNIANVFDDIHAIRILKPEWQNKRWREGRI